MQSNRSRPLALAALAVVGIVSAALAHLMGMDAAAAGIMLAEGAVAVDMTAVMKAMDAIEKQIKAFAEKAEGEGKANGAASKETKDALEKLGNQQKEMADRLLQIEQKATKPPGTETKDGDSWGAQLTKSESLKVFRAGGSTKVRIEVKNTLTGSDATVAPDRRPGIIAGAVQPLAIEDVIPHVPTTSNAVEYTREASFTNNAAETAEGATKPESALTFELLSTPVVTIAHWIKISRQLAADNAALRAYVDTRMRYGVQRRVEQQIINGTGAGGTLSGLLKTGSYTPHGIAAAALGSVLPQHVLMRRIMANARIAGYPPDTIVLNPGDAATLEIAQFTTGNANLVPVNLDAQGHLRIFGLHVVESVAMPADTFLIGALRMAATIYEREAVVVDMSESDGDNFVRNLITLRAERRLAFAVELPAAIIGGDLTPA